VSDLVIALSGYAGVGKDTIAAHMTLNHGFSRVAFADPVRAFLIEQNPAIPEHVSVQGWTPLRRLVAEYGWDAAKRQYPRVRMMLQRTGEAAKTIFGQDVWIRLALERLTDRTVITDVRFGYELDALRAWEAAKPGRRVVSVRVRRDGITPPNDHISERLGIPYEYELDMTSVGLDLVPDAVSAFLNRLGAA